MIEAIAVGLSVSLALSVTVNILLGWLLHSIWKRKDTRDEQWLDSEAGRRDAVRDLGTAKSEVAACHDEIEKLGASLLAASKLYDKAITQQVVGAPTGVLLDLVRGGVHQDPPSQRADTVPGKPAAVVPQPPTKPTRPGARPDLGIIDGDLK